MYMHSDAFLFCASVSIFLENIYVAAYFLSFIYIPLSLSKPRQRGRTRHDKAPFVLFLASQSSIIFLQLLICKLIQYPPRGLARCLTTLTLLPSPHSRIGGFFHLPSHSQLHLRPLPPLTPSLSLSPLPLTHESLVTRVLASSSSSWVASLHAALTVLFFLVLFQFSLWWWLILSADLLFSALGIFPGAKQSLVLVASSLLT